MKVLVGPNNLALEAVLDALRPQYPHITFAHCPDRAALSAALADADVYLGWLSREEFLAARRLRWIQSPPRGLTASWPSPSWPRARCCSPRPGAPTAPAWRSTPSP